MEELKIGQSFEVVEVLTHRCKIEDVEGCGIIVNSGPYNEVIVPRGAWRYIEKPFKCTVALLESFELKRVAKLTITKLK